MTDRQKITDEQLEKELENGKSYKDIAYEYDYGYPSRQLARRIKELGWKKRKKLSINEFGSATLSLTKQEVDRLMKSADPEDKDHVFIDTEAGDDCLCLMPTSRQFFKPDEQE